MEAVPRTQLQRPVFELQGSGPPLVVRADCPSSPAIDRQVEDANEHYRPLSTLLRKHRDRPACPYSGAGSLLGMARLQPFVPASSQAELTDMARATTPQEFPR